jgi:hypothetical protein
MFNRCFVLVVNTAGCHPRNLVFYTVWSHVLLSLWVWNILDGLRVFLALLWTVVIWGHLFACAAFCVSCCIGCIITIIIIIIIRISYLTAVQLFLRIVSVSLTKHFLFTVLPKTFWLYGMYLLVLFSVLECIEQGGDYAVPNCRVIPGNNVCCG